jgi:hypothetical protein
MCRKRFQQKIKTFQVCNTLKYNGEHCDSNDECYSRICHFGFCAGRALGFPCDSKAPVQCAEKLYCSKKTNKCENILRVNDNCQDYHETRPGDNYYIMCPPGTACFSETCELIGSKGIGEECNFDSECVGLFKCYASSQNETKICQGYEALQSCGDNTTCSLTNGEFCICDHSNNKTEGVCKVSDVGQVACGYAEVAKEYQQCWKENGCPLDLYQKVYGTLSFFTESIPNGSCMSEKCGHILKKLFCCVNQMIKNLPHEKMNYFPNKCDEFPSLLIPVIVLFSITMLIMFISSLVVFGISFSQIFIERKN